MKLHILLYAKRNIQKKCNATHAAEIMVTSCGQEKGCHHCVKELKKEICFQLHRMQSQRVLCMVPRWRIYHFTVTRINSYQVFCF